MLKTTAAEQRELWRQVGEALLEGRRLHPSNQAFGKWCIEMGFDMDAPTRSDAVWFASYRGGNTVPDHLSHPKNIRQWDRENQPAPAPAPSLTLTDADRPRPRLTIEAAKKINKLVALAERGVGII